MKNQTVFLLVSISLIVVLTACSKKCIDFDNKIIDWMPYKKNDRIIFFQNEERDTLTVQYSEIYHTDMIGFGAKCSCENSFILNLTSNTFNIDIRFNDSRSIVQSEIVINNEWMNYSEQLENININGKDFTDLIVYKNINPTSSARFEKIFVSKAIGIVAIIGENNEWIIVDDSIKKIEISDLELKRTDC
ncbi:MAG: hypothetical protein HOO86_16150 [Bacteroidales bacterium]|nr:hypothetical protein [Bacteroidales bacterium]